MTGDNAYKPLSVVNGKEKYMKYTYKVEIFLYDKTYKARVILGAIWTVPIIICLFVGQLVPAFVMSPLIFLMIWGLKSGMADYNKWQERRNTMMTKGCRFEGKVVNAGGHKFWVEHWDGDRNENGGKDTYSSRESDWWIEVEYVDTRDHTVKRFTAKNMNRNGKRLIGKKAEVYIYNSQAYINIP